MFKNYSITAWRNLLKNRTYSLLNISGLAAGMAVGLLIGLWVQYQFSYDRFLPGNERVFKAGKMATENGEKFVSMVTPLALAEALKQEVPGIQYVAATDWMKPHGLAVSEKKLYINGAMAGTDFLNIFRYPIVKGNRNQVLKDPYSIVLNETTASALFGMEDPIGKTVRIDNNNDLKVTGIIKDVPENSSLQFSFLVPHEFYVRNDEGLRNNRNNWDLTTSQIYLALEPNTTYEQVQPALQKIFSRHSPNEYAALKTEVILQPLKDWHLFADYKNGVQAGGFIDYVKMFALIGILILLIACINFVNLSTARSEKRAREVGVRKAIGSSRLQLITQFMMEAVIMAFGAFVLALGIVYTVIPAFNQLTGASISIPFTSASFWLMMAIYVLGTALLAGSRPAFYMSSFRPAKVLKGRMQAGKANVLPRKALVVLQFACSIALIISTIVIYQQIRYAKDRPAGFEANALVMTDASKDLKQNYEALKNDLLASGAVTAVSKSSSPVTDNWNFNSIDRWPGKPDGKGLGVAVVAVSDKDYFTTVGMQFATGRNFTGQKDDSLDVIINEAAVQAMDLKEPLNQLITWDGATQARIIGVVKNAIMESPFADAKPALFAFDPNWSNIISYRISPSLNMHQAIAKLAPIFARHNPAIPYLYKFADESYAAKFKSETIVGKLSGVFATLAIFISCLGLFGLAAFTAQQRTREIGIRKVLGASVIRIWFMLSGEFLGLVGISALIATPVVLYLLNEWLSKYNYRIAVSPMVFVVTTLAAFAITLLTVSFQSVKAALSNPVKSLKAD